MTCVRTGFHAYSTEYNEYLYGDAYSTQGVFHFRVCQRSREPLNDRLHFTIHEIAYWFDQNRTGPESSTLIAKSATFHSYEGIPCSSNNNEGAY